MDLSISNPESYLCWPTTPDSAALLESLYAMDLSDPRTFSYRYSADSEHVCAHVSIQSKVRLVFIRGSAGDWKYHDMAHMPFPSPSYLTIHEALDSVRSQCGADVTLPDIPIAATPPGATDDDYWDAYGQDDDDRGDYRPANQGNELSEDAYWAQYSTVQGTADSEIPSPLPVNPKQSNGDATAPQMSAPPAQLAQRLSELTSRPTMQGDALPVRSQISTGPPSPSSILQAMTLKALPPVYSQPRDNGLFRVDPAAAAAAAVPPNPSPSDAAAKDGVRAIFKLWSASNTKPIQSQLEQFTQLVKEATSEQ